MRKVDPQDIGTWLLVVHETNVGKTFAELCDEIPWDTFPPMRSESTVDTTVAQYRDDLQREAAGGSATAQTALNRLG
jgi:hypothetical protein